MSRLVDLLTHIVTPAVGYTYRGWKQTLRVIKSEGGIHFRYCYRSLAIKMLAILTSAFQFYEKKKLTERIQKHKFNQEPVFIIGHWRSGTTHLHNLLSLDPQFGFVTTLQTVFPHSYVTNGIFPRLALLLMPPTRPFDSMKISSNSPQEEEMALLNCGPYSFYNFWFSPDNMKAWYHRTIDFKQGSQEEINWCKSYIEILQKASFVCGGKRLLLKNPPNTGRIPTLVKQFPKAKFIFIHRDPLEVYPSTQKLHRNVVPMFCLQKYNFDNVKEGIRYVYRNLLQRYLDTKSHIPQENLIEIRFESLLQEPINVLSRLYSELNLGEYESLQPIFTEYLSDKMNYKPAKYDIPQEELNVLKNEWGFSFEEWGYDLR
jgi:omega-hydroxy-beta-dihydromenaquinone-9 sulfotransferase